MKKTLILLALLMAMLSLCTLNCAAEPADSAPVIGAFYPDWYTGYEDARLPDIHWNVLQMETLTIYVNGAVVHQTDEASGSLQLLRFRTPGNYTVKAVAANSRGSTEKSFLYVCIGTQGKYIIKCYDVHSKNEITAPIYSDTTYPLGTEVRVTAPVLYGYTLADSEPKTVKIVKSTEMNVLSFYYYRKVKYTVRYLDAATGRDIIAPKTVSDAHEWSTVTEEAPTFEYYEPCSTPSVSRTLVKNEEDNVIIFRYDRIQTQYTVHFLDADTRAPIAPDAVYPSQSVGEVLHISAPEFRFYVSEGATDTSLRLQRDAEQNDVTFLYSYASIPASYTVKYLDKGTGLPLRDEETVYGAHLCNILTMEAPAVEGYDCILTPQTFIVDTDPTKNTFIFYYSRPTEYVIRCVHAQTGAELLPPRTVTDAFAWVDIRVEAPEIENYVPEEAEKTLTLQADKEQNVIMFTYTPEMTTCEVRYLQMEDYRVVMAPPKTLVVPIGTEVTEEAPEITGYAPTEGHMTLTAAHDPAQNIITFWYTNHHTEPFPGAPEIAFFYPDDYTASVSELTKVYWKVPAALEISILVDGQVVCKTRETVGEIAVSQLMREGRHMVTISAFNVVDTIESTFIVQTLNPYGFSPVLPPQTGDNTALLFLPLALSALGISACIRKKKRNDL